MDDYIAIVKRRKWHAIIPAFVLLVIAILAALLIPPVYRSSATILIERQEIPVDLVRTTVTSYADQRIQVISQRVMTTSNLSGLIERYDLYPDIRSKQSINAAVEEMRKWVKLDMISADVLDPQSGRAQEATIAFSLSFENRSAAMTQKVTSDLVSLFLNENLERRAAAANEATNFLQVEASRLGSEISTLEARLATFKEDNSDNLPELASLNRELMIRTEERLRDNGQAIRTLQQQVLYLESELAQLDPTLGGYSGIQANSVEAYLEELQTRYVRAKERYSPDHPDRIQLEKEIEALQQNSSASSAAFIQSRLDGLIAESSSLKKRYSDEHPEVIALNRSIADTRRKLEEARKSIGTQSASTATINNPAHVQLRVKLEGTQQELESLKRTSKQLEDQLRGYEERITKAPRVEQEYRALTRDYENAMAKYQEIREKGLQAELAQSLERDRKSERFSLIEPPLLPEKPFKPNRLAIFVLGFVLAGAGGVGSLALSEALDKGLHGPRAIQMATNLPLLAIVPYIETATDQGARRKRTRTIMAFGVVGILTLVAVFHWAVLPLDVLWFVVMRRFDVSLPGLSN
nr:lipopolysaccharide biosynthesis protein [Thiocystis violacea]